METRRIKWLFFDLGSTLIDESACDIYRTHQLAAQEGAPPFGVIIDMLRQSARRLLPPYKTVVKTLGLTAAEWPAQLETLYPGVPRLLNMLCGRYGLGIIANQNPGVEARLARFGIRQYFKVIASSAEEGFLKPDPGIFIRALERAGCRADEAVMIGDRPDNDIFPAAKLGMTTIWVRQGLYADTDDSLLPQRPDLTIDSISDIAKFL